MIPKFRVWDKEQVIPSRRIMWTVDRINLDDGTVDVHVWTEIGHQAGCGCHSCEHSCGGMEKTSNFGLKIDDRIILMQSTGLRDKKRTKEFPEGQEVFEGDIILYMDGENMLVQWSSDGYIGWELYRKKRMGKHFHHIKYMYYDHSRYPKAAEEVIGNIHANPELLTANQEVKQ